MGEMSMRAESNLEDIRRASENQAGSLDRLAEVAERYLPEIVGVLSRISNSLSEIAEQTAIANVARGFTEE